MKLYKITFDHNQIKYVVAESYGEAEKLFNDNTTVFTIDNMEQISSSVLTPK